MGYQQRGVSKILRRPHRLFRPIIPVCVALMLSLLSISRTSSANEDQKTAGMDTRAEYQTVKIGVLAKRGVERCQAKWSPTAEYLTSKIQRHSFSIVPLDFDEIHPAVEKGEVDFVLANSSFYVRLEHLFGTSRIATLNNLTSGKGHTVYGGVIFCRADRKDMRHLKDLKGKTFMAVKETSFGGWLAAWQELKNHAIDPHEDFASLSYGGTHDAVVYAVRDGKADAGTVRTDVLERMAMENRICLEDFFVFSHGPVHHLGCEFPFVHSTVTYPEWPFAKARHTSDALAKRVTVALLEMSSDNPAAIAARCAGWTVSLNYQPVHDCLKELRVAPYEDYGKVTFGDMLKQHWFWITSCAFLLFTSVLIAFRTTRLNRRLQENKKYIQSILNSVHVGIVLIDAETHTIVDANPLVAEMIGLPEEEIVGKKSHKFLSPAEIGQYPVTEHNQAMESSESILTKTDGTSIPILKTVVPITLNQRKCLLGCFVDITKRKQAERKLRELDQAIEKSPEGIAIASIDGIHVFVNPAWAKMHGYQIADLIGKPVAMLDTPEGRNNISHIMEEIKKNGLWRGETQRVRKDGSSFPTIMTSSIVTDAKDKQIGIVGTCIDITERKWAEEQLEVFRRFAEESNHGVGWTDIKGNVIYVNPALCRIFGEVRPEDTYGNPVAQFYDDHTQQRLAEEIFPKVIAEGKWIGELDIHSKNGNVLRTLNNLFVLRDAKDNPLYFSHLVTDITERKRAEGVKAALQTQLLQSEKLASVGQLSAGVAHEINNPIGFISSNLGTMKKYLTRVRSYIDSNGGQDPDEQNEITEIVTDFGDAIAESLDGADRVKKIVADLKGFARTDSGELEATDLNAELESTLNIVWNQIKYTCKVEKDFGELPGVQCHKGQINQVMLNLLVNAGQAIGDGPGIIRIRTWADDTQCYISIKDDGCGISEEQIGKIFDPFYTTKDVGKGTGLGLSVSHDIIKSHGGRIEVRSEVGQGSEFVVSLPIESSMVEPVEAPVTSEDCTA